MGGTTDYPLRTTHYPYPLSTTHYPLPTTRYPLSTTHCRLSIPGCQVRQSERAAGFSPLPMFSSTFRFSPIVLHLFCIFMEVCMLGWLRTGKGLPLIAVGLVAGIVIAH